MFFSLLISLFISRVVINRLGGNDDYRIYGVVGVIVVIFCFSYGAMMPAKTRFFSFGKDKEIHYFLEKTIIYTLLIQVRIAQIWLIFTEIFGFCYVSKKLSLVFERKEANDLVFHEGQNHQTCNIYEFYESQNINIVKLSCKQLNIKLVRHERATKYFITYANKRVLQDFLFAINAIKINQELSCKTTVNFEEELDRIIDWSLNIDNWLNNLISGVSIKGVFKNSIN